MDHNQSGITQCNLADEISLHGGQIDTRILAHSDRYNYSLMRLSEGKELEKHQSTGDIGMYVIDGRAKLVLSEGSRLLNKGDFVFVGARTLQQLLALTDLTLLHVLTH